MNCIIFVALVAIFITCVASAPNPTYQIAYWDGCRNTKPLGNFTCSSGAHCVSGNFTVSVAPFTTLSWNNGRMYVPTTNGVPITLSASFVFNSQHNIRQAIQFTLMPWQSQSNSCWWGISQFDSVALDFYNLGVSVCLQGTTSIYASYNPCVPNNL